LIKLFTNFVIINLGLDWIRIQQQVGSETLIKLRTYTERQSGSEVTTVVRRIKRGRILMKGEKLYLKNSKGKNGIGGMGLNQSVSRFSNVERFRKFK
jgi:hypothetical protein